MPVPRFCPKAGARDDRGGEPVHLVADVGAFQLCPQAFQKAIAPFG